METTTKRKESSTISYTPRRLAAGLILASALFIAVPDKAADIIVKTPSAVVVVNAQNVFNAIPNEEVMLGLVKTSKGRKLLAKNADTNNVDALMAISSPPGYDFFKSRGGFASWTVFTGVESDMSKYNIRISALAIAVSEYESVGLALIRTEAGRELLANTKDSNGTSALHYAVFHQEGISLELSKTPEGRALLANTKESHGRSALDMAVTFNDDTGLEFVRTKGGRELLMNTKDSSGSSALESTVYRSEDAVLELIKTTEGRDLLANTKDLKGAPLLHSALKTRAHDYPAVAVALVKTPEGRALLADTMGPYGENELYIVVSEHPQAAIEVLKIPEARSILAKTKGADGKSALDEANSMQSSYRPNPPIEVLPGVYLTNGLRKE
jgi:hypothetical protein